MARHEVCWSRSSDPYELSLIWILWWTGPASWCWTRTRPCLLPTYVMSNCSCTQGYMWRACFYTLFHEGYRLSWWYTQTHPEPSRKPPNCFQLYLPQGSSNITSNENIMWQDRAAQENWTATSSMALQDSVCREQPSTIFICIWSLLLLTACVTDVVCDYELNLCSSFWSFLCFFVLC